MPDSPLEQTRNAGTLDPAQHKASENTEQGAPPSAKQRSIHFTAMKVIRPLLIVSLSGVLVYLSRKLPAVQFVSDFSTKATTLIGSLVIITAFVERSTAAINAATIGVAINDVDTKMEATPIGNERQLLKSKMSDLQSTDQKMRVTGSFLFGLLISISGVRTLGTLLSKPPPTSWQPECFNAVDIVLTAGLIAGGTHGLSRILTLVKSQYSKGK